MINKRMVNITNEDLCKIANKEKILNNIECHDGTDMFFYDLSGIRSPISKTDLICLVANISNKDDFDIKF